MVVEVPSDMHPLDLIRSGRMSPFDVVIELPSVSRKQGSELSTGPDAYPMMQSNVVQPLVVDTIGRRRYYGGSRSNRW